MDRSFVDRNDASRERLLALVARLGDDDLARPLAGDWTIAAALAHVAFWDNFVLARWRDALAADGAVRPIDDNLQDLINSAALSTWRAISPPEAARLATTAAAAVDGAIKHLPPEAIRGAQERGQHRLLDRSAHRRDHIDEIERALANGS
jgi:hypothetical protein